MSLRLRLSLWYGTLLAVSLLSFGLLVYFVLRTSLESQIDETLRVRGADVARRLSTGSNGVLDSADLVPAVFGPLPVEEALGPDLYMQVLDEHAELAGASGSLLPIDPEAVIAALQGRETLTTLPLIGGRTVRVLTRPLTEGGRTVGVLQVGNTLDTTEATLHQVRGVLTIASLAVLALAGLGGFLFASRALAPVRRVSATARRIAATGDYAARLPVPRARDEVGELVSTFNALIERVESSLEEQRRFLADTSHELRSPLTVMRANLGFLWRETDSETRAECLREAEAEAARMSRLVSDLLLLGQSGAGEFLTRAPLRLDELVQEVGEQATVQAGGRRILLEPLDPVVVRADRDRLKQLLWNLVENALRYTPNSATIRIWLRRGDGWAELGVADDGPGIPAEHLPRIFDRFYRVDPARSRASGGSGLGLAIVRHIARAHGGGVSVESVPGHGATFRVRLPAQQDASVDQAIASAEAELGERLPALGGARQ